jgi:ribosomal protein S12 methylthiotransferase accessory factor
MVPGLRLSSALEIGPGVTILKGPCREEAMEFKVKFSGGMRVDADLGGLVVPTDQQGGAPTPFALFLASLGTCAGVYVLGFCRNRGLDVTGIELTQRMTNDPESGMVSDVEFIIHVPKAFPEKYHEALIRSAMQCKVKKHLEQPPRFTTRVEAY